MTPKRRGRVRGGVLAFLLIIGAFFALRARSHRSPSNGATQEGNTRSDDANTLTVLAGSELKDLEPLLPDLQRATGVTLKLAYSGTLAGIDRLNAGDHFDAAWFSHAKYLVLNDATTNRVKAQEKTMLSPVVLGIKQSVAHRFGWDAKSPTWADIARRAKAGELRYAMTNPTASNSGFSAVIGVAAALSGTSSALTSKDVDPAKLREFFNGQSLTAGSSGWLADAYVRDQDALDGIINYESILLSLNKGGLLHEPLQLVYPREGIVTADYPIVLLDASKRAAYDRVVAWLKSAPVQQRIMTTTFRRPVNSQVTLDPLFPAQMIVELDFPSDLDAINAVLLTYLNAARRPAHSVFVLDVSGSMRGNRLDQLKQALLTLAGSDSTLTGRFARFQEREQVTLIPFSSMPQQPTTIPMGASATLAGGLQRVRDYATELQAGGGTAIYSSLAEAYRFVQNAASQDSLRYYSIVLMTDGENNEGMKASEFRDFYQSLPPAARRVKVFPIIFGEARQQELASIAELTGGRLFDGSKSALAPVFKEIRGYQ
jgi:Ca-activated chloride channel family protein